MTFLRITDEHPSLVTLRHWYTDSFPPTERRTFDDLVALLACPDMHLCALLLDTQVVGFIVFWQWKDLVFIEHFAIDPQQRGQQLGRQAMAHMIATNDNQLVLEVEQPETEPSQRRIRFYEQLGFSLTPFPYVQPPYQAGNAGIPMRLMSIPAITSQRAFAQISAGIKERVYERFYSN